MSLDDDQSETLCDDVTVLYNIFLWNNLGVEISVGVSHYFFLMLWNLVFISKHPILKERLVWTLYFVFGS